jgi:hypothetical protein
MRILRSARPDTVGIGTADEVATTEPELILAFARSVAN